MSDFLKFRVSSALKDILGRDLITDDYIAVFELVKNSYDAHAKRVDIIFENINSGNGRIIIKDDGKGMNYNDLLNKWLFVGYSAKREGTEDDNYDYRSNIHANRLFAGAKGIGRFSCDKLGANLYIETIKQEKNSKVESLMVEWQKFEKNLKDEFVDIEVVHSVEKESNFGLEHGTVLVIDGLRSEWPRWKYLKLKDSLAKLINPQKGENEPEFSIVITAEEEKEADEAVAEEESYNRVNGVVKNFIFDTLQLKTTKITSTISKDGTEVCTELRDGGTLIYKITEDNKFSLLESVGISLFYLNMSAKLTFTRRMGVSSAQYGHVFLYKNGFRVYPYGEPGDDPLKIDVRKAQGYRRFLGTRDLIGQIQIFSTSNQLKETSTRGDGLIKTPTYYQLENFFLEVLKRLERYVIDVQRWGLSIEDENSFDVKARISELLARLTDSQEITSFETNNDFLTILEASQINSAEAIVQNLTRIANEKGDEQLKEEVRKAEDKLKDLQEAKFEAEKQAAIEFKKAQEATAQLREKISENLFLKSINTSEYEEVIALLHHIGIYAGTIDSNLRGISLRVQNDIPLGKEELNNIVRSLSFETKKIMNVVSFATKANFKMKTEDIEIDLNDYIREYVQNIIPTVTDKSIKIHFSSNSLHPFVRVVKAIEINIVIDNIINNARKAGASKVDVIINEMDNEKLEVSFVDDGVGLKEENMPLLYNFGFTTTDGSGLGLYHVKQIMDSIKGKITANNNESGKGATFKLEFK